MASSSAGFIERVLFAWLSTRLQAIEGRLSTLETQGGTIMATVADLIAAGDAGRDEILAAIAEETAEIANLIATQLANPDVVTPENIAEVQANASAIVARIRGISDALTAPAPTA